MQAQVSALLYQKPELDELLKIQELLDRAQGFTKGVLSMEAEADAAPAPRRADGERSPATRPCVICLRVERALWEFMAHRQYELAVSEAEQRRHALHSGFCPLHTWQYQTIASPQGVCAAYPQLLTFLARQLRTLAEKATSVQAIADGLQSMLPKESLCPACQLIASTKKTAAYELARRLSSDNGGAVCAFHLRSLLAADPDLKAATALVQQEADVLGRLAEDMQNHVLKHEAVRHNLTTDAERDAATAGLAQLVGRRNTVAPRKLE